MYVMYMVVSMHNRCNTLLPEGLANVNALGKECYIVIVIYLSSNTCTFYLFIYFFFYLFIFLFFIYLFFFCECYVLKSRMMTSTQPLIGK